MHTEINLWIATQLNLIKLLRLVLSNLSVASKFVERLRSRKLRWSQMHPQPSSVPQGPTCRGPGAPSGQWEDGDTGDGKRDLGQRGSQGSVTGRQVNVTQIFITLPR
jgi:hypothetical protein